MTSLVKRTVLIVALVGVFCVASEANAGPWYGSYWGLDYKVTWEHTYGSVTVPTGYYNGWIHTPVYPYNWGYGWGAHDLFYGFRDTLTYSYSCVTPRVSWWWSYYWDPAGQGNTLDMVTSGDDSTGFALPFAPSIMPCVDVLSHTFIINDGYDSGSFTDFEWVVATDMGIRTYLGGLGLLSGSIEDFMIQPRVEQVIAGNSGGMVVGFQHASYLVPVPEPGTLALLAFGGLTVLAAAWIRRRRAA